MVGSLLAAICFIAWGASDTPSSAPRQTVVALWLIAGFIGSLIAAVGVVGATIVQALDRSRNS
jgi:hypothetical protein